MELPDEFKRLVQQRNAVSSASPTSILDFYVLSLIAQVYR
jgi:hypothetical protein